MIKVNIYQYSLIILITSAFIYSIGLVMRRKRRLGDLWECWTGTGSATLVKRFSGTDSYLQQIPFTCCLILFYIVLGLYQEYIGICTIVSIYISNAGDRVALNRSH